ncbi:hypothetical protein RhiirC2_787830 [Rhizophagus irregularis]|uniref:Tc1-like transposase DDE domain-containing protein n=1 Tax=Rhizophagus irregularis TaxID=588596 RepID=A0A2N1MRF5_9GLOM|nr:hypothetical protein RhiirC2_787830 [Rhizophagus irregularis]
MSKSSVARIINIYKKWTYITNPFKGISERRKLFSRNDMHSILQNLVRDKVNWYLNELVCEMENLPEKRASIVMLWKSLYYLGITRKKLQKKAYKRSDIMLAFYLGIIGKHYTSNQLIFIDESVKDERTLTRLYGYSSRNIYGFVAVDIFEGACDKNKFINFVLNKVVPIMNSYPSNNSVIIIDNARIHHDADLILLLEGLECHVIFLLPYSPDYMSPNGIIEEKGGVFGDLTECEAVKNWTEENLKEFEEVGNRFITEALHWHDGTANSIKVVYTGKLRTTM